MFEKPTFVNSWTFVLSSLFALFLVTSSKGAFCTGFESVIEQLDDEMHVAFFLEPQQSEAIFVKYGEKKAEYLRWFIEALDSGKVNFNSVRNIIFVLGLLHEKEQLSQVIKWQEHVSSEVRDAVTFYLYCIEDEKEHRVNDLRKRFAILVERPTDSFLIVYLAFLNDLEFSIHYLDLLAAKSDGATSELVGWVANYLYYKTRNDPVARQKLKTAGVYELYIRPPSRP
jgi:hypothetical protein